MTRSGSRPSRTARRLQEELKRRGVPATVTIQDVTTFRVDGVPPAQDQAFRQAAEQEAREFRPKHRHQRHLYVPDAARTSPRRFVNEAVVQARQTIERRVNELGVTEPSIAQQGRRSDHRSAARCHRRRPRKRDHRFAGHARAQARRAGTGRPAEKICSAAPAGSCRRTWKC